MESWLQKTPGYNFALRQGLKATQNAYSAQGLGQSGAATKGAINYAEGLANTTFQQQFQNFLQTQQQQFGQAFTGGSTLLSTLLGQGGQGTSAAGALAGSALGFSGQTTQSLGQAGAANASGAVGSANAWTGALGNLAGIGSNVGTLFALMGGSQGGLFGGNSIFGGNSMFGTPSGASAFTGSNASTMGAGGTPFFA
jgi:hypothetical protein